MEEGNPMNEKTVYVLAWEYWGGGGFDWFHNREDATRAWECGHIATENNREGWTWYYAEVDVNSTEPDAITAEVDGLIWDVLPDDRPCVKGLTEQYA